ncbi:MAG: pyrroline-5-carboxylate reductase [Defluviitaleaceae bacterium]|nr:pyrroline-5-carboxylate reductase [Defluviitaleaceae bacterium]
MAIKLGFIGAGNMASAIIGGVVASKKFLGANIYVSNKSAGKVEKLAEKFGIQPASNKTVAETADVIFLCVKPNTYDAVIAEVKSVTTANKIVVAIAAGKTVQYLEAAFGGANAPKIVRAMPNTPSLVKQGMTAICPAQNVPQKDANLVLDIFAAIGQAEFLPEALFDAFTGVAGSSPAYAFMFVEAMADAGVAHGLPRDAAMRFSAQALLGAAQMVLSTGNHPGALKDGVCSPGGATIAAVAKLEEQGFRNAIIQGVNACVEKSIKMQGE